MWYRVAQLYDTQGKNLLEFNTEVPRSNPVTLSGLPGGFNNQSLKQWSSITWSPQRGLQFWNSSGKLIGTQNPGATVFETLRTLEPQRLKSDFTDKIVLDVYRRGKVIEQAVSSARQQNPSLTLQQATQIAAQQMRGYYITPRFDDNGNLQNLPEYYPQQSAQDDAGIKQMMAQEYNTTPRQPGEKNIEFTEVTSEETGQQYRKRYTDAYNRAYAEYNANGSKIPFTQWKKQFDDAFARGQTGFNNQPVMNQVTTQNQAAGTYKMQQDAAGNVSILQSDGRAYAYIPASQVQYQIAYIKKMTGQTPQAQSTPITK